MQIFSGLQSTAVSGPIHLNCRFSIEQMAVGHGQYVTYLNLSARGSQGYPRRSTLADCLPDPYRVGLEECEAFWECTIAVSIWEVAICEQVGITPAGYYNLQALNLYSDYNDEIAQLVKNLFKEYCSHPVKIHMGSKFESPHIVKFLVGYPANRSRSLQTWRDLLQENSDNDGPLPLHETGDAKKPRSIICIDEARALLDSEGCIQFRAFRQACRNLFKRLNHKDSPDLTRLVGNYFAVCLDTTPKVGTFSPPLCHDPSQKTIKQGDSIPHTLFPPVNAINTWDIFASRPCSEPDGSDQSKRELFKLGRPLWGGRLDTGSSLEEVMELASQKTIGNSPSHALALFSYRVNFYVTQNSLAEELVGSWLRYLLYINPSRELMRTIQPSEPVLAHTAAEKMRDPAIRFYVVKNLARACFEGSINMGDIGEMVAALILLFAFDATDPENHPCPVRFQRFLCSLLGSEICQDIGMRAASDQDMFTLWQDGQVFFNHFIRAETSPTLPMLHAAYRRGAALFLPERFPGADVLVPIKLPDDEVTFLVIQVKNRKHDRLTNSLKSQAVSSIDSAVTAMNIPAHHIGLMMCLRGDVLEGDDSLGSEVLAPLKRTTSTRSGTQGQQYAWPTKNKKVIITTVGLDETIYPSVNQISLDAAVLPGSEFDTFPILRQLLLCIPGTSLPEDADRDYARRLMELVQD
ncbi:hypothetical protein ASPZODRAFT_161487 [Penicilliopsis zonata CBS 506.65]|uniref:Uncharacterized protein n=1 Tax=Penicilliopsis zonata CBS 506.65 TaxID=1073090 RepID=A0A1L9S8S5_9EURO|nr:hypothetical protein ASPZODRAFT_161487 [Penicilliopsis zonata CBS 506.65]OJJ43558.1 hypothetical protein ASPZODRAFT_161487 [Penicilliopsis zonata CBS 506.65]